MARPRVDPNHPSVFVGVTLPASSYDKLARQALKHDVSVAEMIRRKLREEEEKKSKNPRR